RLSDYSILFFFFQAEDGIRDLYVTGVQTCALPICLGYAVAQPRRADALRAQLPLWNVNGVAAFVLQQLPRFKAEYHASFACVARSEERRVGKECRSRGSR